MSRTPPVEYAGIPLPEVQVITNVMLSAETTEKVLNALDVLPNIRQIIMTGESISKNIGNGPAKGLPNNHSERKVIKVGGRDVELQHLVGGFYIELDVENEDMLNETIAKIDEACKATIPKGFNLNVGRYSKYKSSLTDYRGE